jgi:glucosamine--fructose-6-phosphate aminotransferase (isomerizing)
MNQARGAREAGAVYRRELYQQPETLAALAKRGEEFGALAEQLRRSRSRLVRLAGHGSSDNAASYGTYAFGLIAGLPAFRDSISLAVYYDTDFDLADSLVIALSQSGRTPDVVSYLAHAASQGATTLAVTADLDSPLAEVADACVSLGTGQEEAIAATKTYTAELGILALLAAHLAGVGERYASALEEAASALAAWLAAPPPALEPLAAALLESKRMMILARGPEFATARETALKLLETCRLAATPLTTTDFAHGPVAALDPDFPTWIIAAADATLPAARAAAERARAAGCSVIVSGTGAGALAEQASVLLPSAASPEPLLGPILSIAAGQLFALALARAKGLDPDAPAGISKVTLAP